MPGSTAKTVAGWTGPAASEARGPELAPRASLYPVRRLPVERDWPFAAIAGVQAGILIGLVALWEIGADTGFIEQFFWSQPSAIFRTLTIFFATGDAFTDIAFTFRSTILGFFIGMVAGAALGLSFWWSRNYAAIVQPYVICFESLPKLALAPLIVLVFGIGLASKVAIATALTLVVSTLTTYGGVKAVDPDGEKLFYSLGATRFQVFRKLVIPSCLPWIISVLRVNYRPCLDRCGRRRVHRLRARPWPRYPLCWPDLRYRAGLGRRSGALGAGDDHVCHGVLDRAPAQPRHPDKSGSEQARRAGHPRRDPSLRRFANPGAWVPNAAQNYRSPKTSVLFRTAALRANSTSTR
jgi:NitT/TauT family transport system permease protein